MRKIAIIFTLLLSACTATKHTVTNNPVAESPDVRQSSQRIILQPEVERPLGWIPREQMPLYYDDRSNNALPQGWAERSFTSRESANVTVPAANPLPPEGLKLDLSRLATNFCYPYRGNMISDYGMRSGSMHSGVDIKAVPNDTVRAAFDGIVRMSREYSNYGNVSIYALLLVALEM